MRKCARWMFMRDGCGPLGVVICARCWLMRDRVGSGLLVDVERVLLEDKIREPSRGRLEVYSRSMYTTVMSAMQEVCNP